MKEIFDFEVVSNESRGEKYFLLTLAHGRGLLTCVPGQFVEIRVDGCADVMLRRPISIHDAYPDKGTMKLLVQEVGKGTKQLRALKAGEKLNLVYPLGRGFTTDITQKSKVLMIGGGAGIAPLLFLSRVLCGKGCSVDVLLGGRTKSLIPVYEEFQPYATTHISTDDGSLGHKGVVTSHPIMRSEYDIIYTCGPTPMMKAVAKIASERGIRCEVSLENVMACGLGACLCCVTPTDLGHRCVCKDGPVFDISNMKSWYKN
ncbi:MAG: dihydroorotate dehydrogenase electron transfer subunit [Bacteroidales bacterium]|nr:dihydroorotate dehydrogenase electron transfer subunit [Bacteroidales bacterium]